MTMQEPSGHGTVTVVGPGDPTFSDPNAATQSNAAPVGSQPNPSNVQQDPAQNQPANAASAAPAAPATAAAPGAVTFTPEQEAALQARIAAAHSGLDRKINTLQTALQDKEAEIERAQEEAQKQIRAAQANGLSEDERKRLESLWADEDRLAAIEKREKAVGQLYLSVEGLRLLTKYESQGVLEEDILEYKGDPSQLETFIKALAYERLTDPNAGKPAASAAKAPPAGSAAAVDMGNTPSINEGPKMLTTQGLDSMAANIKTLFADDKPVVPWS